MADPLYVAARRVLLDAMEALHDHWGSVVLVGAQAIYARTGHADLDLSVAPFTTDADLSLDPRGLSSEPDIKKLMQEAGFVLTCEPGIWCKSVEVDGRIELIPIPVDLLVAETLAGAGRRSARLVDHGKNAARRTPGLEAAAADFSGLTIASLEPHLDGRVMTVQVAGSAALLVAKAHKLTDRLRDYSAGRVDRLKPKDASDVFRLMQTEPADKVGLRLREIAQDDMAGPSVRAGVEGMRTMFGRRRSPGVDLTVKALQGCSAGRHRSGGGHGVRQRDGRKLQRLTTARTAGWSGRAGARSSTHG